MRLEIADSRAKAKLPENPVNITLSGQNGKLINGYVHEVSKHQKEHIQMNDKLPTWHIEALEQGIDYIVLIYEKAEGFVFCPSNLEKPLRVGGDYDGNMPTTAKGALSHYNGYFNNSFRDRIEWFIEFVRKIEYGEDFSLKDLEIEKRNLRVISGKWPW